MTPTGIETFTLDALGGTGDTLSYAGTTSAVTVNLATTAATGFASITGVEHVTGGSGGDSLTGNGGVNTLTGGGGQRHAPRRHRRRHASTAAMATTPSTTRSAMASDTIDGGETVETLGDTLAVTGTVGDDTIDVVLTGSIITTIEGEHRRRHRDVHARRARRHRRHAVLCRHDGAVTVNLAHAERHRLLRRSPASRTSPAARAATR